MSVPSHAEYARLRRGKALLKVDFFMARQLIETGALPARHAAAHYALVWFHLLRFPLAAVPMILWDFWKGLVMGGILWLLPMREIIAAWDRRCVLSHAAADPVFYERIAPRAVIAFPRTEEPASAADAGPP